MKRMQKYLTIIVDKNESFEEWAEKFKIDSDSELYQDLDKCYMESENEIQYAPVFNFDDDEFARHGMDVVDEYEEDTNSYITTRSGCKDGIAESIYNEYVGETKLDPITSAYIYELIKDEVYF